MGGRPMVSPAISRSSNSDNHDQSTRFERKGRKQRTSGRPSNRSSNNPFARNLDRKRSKRQKKKMDRESYHTPIGRKLRGTPPAQVSWSMDSEIEEPVTRYQIVDSDGGSMSYVDFDDTM